MIRKSELDGVIDELNEEDRRTLGEPPTFEELQAYAKGELSPEEEARVRALLVCYPELARTMTLTFAEDGDAANVVPFRRRHSVWTAVAAVLAIVFAGLYWQAESKARRLGRELASPQLAPAEQILLPDGSRGPDGATTVSATGDSLVLVATLINEARYPSYRLEIRDAGAKPLWSRSGLQPRENDTFAIVVPHAFLPPGRYQVVVHGLEGGRETQVASYSIRIPDSPASRVTP